MQTQQRQMGVEGLAAVIRVLGDRVGCAVSEDDLAEALRTVAPWTELSAEELLAAASPTVGLRSSRIRASVRDAAPRARRDMPLVCWVDNGLTRGWIVLDDWRLRRVHVWSSTTWLPTGWLSIEALDDLLGTDIVEWTRVEPLLPAAPLGRRGRDHQPSPVQRLRGLVTMERDAVAVVVVYAVAVGVLSLATPLAIQVLINWLAFGALYQPVVFLSIALLLCLGLAAGLRAAQRYVVELVQRRIFVRTVSDLGARLARVRIEGLDKVYGPELVNRFFDVLTLQKATKTLLIDGLTAALQAAVGLLLLAVYHPYLLVFDVVVMTLAAIALFPWVRRGQDTAILESKKKYAVAAWIEEIARHPVVFKLGGTRLAEDRLERLSRDYLESRASHFRVFFRQYVGMQAVAVVVQVGLLLTAGWLVLEGQLTLGQLVAAEFIVTAALMGLAKFTEKLEVVYDLLAGIDKLGTLLDLEPDRPSGIAIQGGPEGAALALRNVGFRWSATGRTMLTGVELDLEPGSRTAIVGAAGSGKTVLGELLVGMRPPTEGALWRDGLPLERMLPEQVYGETLLLKKDTLVHGTVRDNVVLGRLEVKEETLWEALDHVGIAQTIAAFPRGLDTELSPTGSPLSDTQGRALVLARALVLPPRLLVVDGLFDGVTPALRGRLLGVIARLDRKTTVVVLTEEFTVGNTQERVFEATEGGLHARPRLSSL